MPCPHSRHGTPDRCSQCLGVTPRHIDYDPTAERLLIDGEDADRDFDVTKPQLTRKQRLRFLRRTP